MTEIPKFDDSVVAAIDRALEKFTEQPRPHLGASIVGNPCERAVWYSFRWATIDQFPGRIKRLFSRGHREEAEVVKYLQMAGILVTDTGNDQSRVDFGCHVSGSIDGIIQSGVPDAPKSKHILEIKTHNTKSFDAMVKHGVQIAKPLHYTQMQMYMLGTKIDRALYVAVCKNDDRMYTERVKLDKSFATEEVSRAKRIAITQWAPAKMSNNPSWFECKFCSHISICHQKEATANKSCRTCQHSRALEDGTWFCDTFRDKIPLDFQYRGCDNYVIHEDIRGD